MGSALGSSGLAILATIAIIGAGILTIMADNKVKGIPGYDGNDNLNLAHKDLGYAQIFIWVSAVFSFILTLGYIFVHTEWLQSEWLHLIIFILAAGTLVIGISYLGIALNRINNVEGDNGGNEFIWAAIITAGIGLLVLLVKGIWRLTHKRVVEPKEKEISQTEALAQRHTVVDEKVMPGGRKEIRTESTQTLPPPERPFPDPL